MQTLTKRTRECSHWWIGEDVRVQARETITSKVMNKKIAEEQWGRKKPWFIRNIFPHYKVSGSHLHPQLNTGTKSSMTADMTSLYLRSNWNILDKEMRVKRAYMIERSHKRGNSGAVRQGIHHKATTKYFI